MNLRKKEIQIVKLLISATTYMSSYEIAENTGINRRLIRDEMNNVKSVLKSLGYKLISKASKGYRIEPIGDHSIQDLSAQIDQIECARYSYIPTLPKERVDYIIKRILDADGYIKIDDLASELLISRSSVSKDLKTVKETLFKYSLIVKQKPNYGLKIIGREIDRRKPLCDYVFTNFENSAMFYDLLNSIGQDIELIENHILSILDKFKIEMSDISLCDFFLCLSVSISRMQLGHYLDVVEDVADIIDCNEFKAAKEITNFLQTEIRVEIPNVETLQVGIELISKRSSALNSNTTNDAIRQLVNKIISEINKQTIIDFHNYNDLYDTLIQYTQSALLRLKYNTKSRNPLYLELKYKYPLGYELAEITSNVIYEHTGKYLSQGELGFFSIIFNTALNKGVKTKKKVLLICGLGRGATELVEWQLNERFANEIDIIKTTQFYKLNKENLDNYDFIITSFPIHQNLDIPHINISPIVEDEDLNKIANYLNYTYNRHGVEICFHPKLFVKNSRVKTKKGAISELYKVIKEQYPTLTDSFKNAIFKEEKTVTYECNNIITILKSEKSINNNNVISVLLLNNPIVWTQQETKIVILLSLKFKKDYTYNAIINSITKLAKNNTDIDDLFKQPSYDNFIRILKKYE